MGNDVGAHKSSSSRSTLPPVLLALAVFAYAITFSILTLKRYAAFEARSQDLGNLNQAVWNLANGNGLRFTNYEGIVSRLSLHVEPILLPIAGLYRLYPHPELLLVLQAVIVALGAIPLFALARHKLDTPWAGLIFGLVFLLNPAIQGANWYEFHPVTLAPTLLMAAFYFLTVKRGGWFAFFAILAAGTKEDIALLVFMMGLYAVVILRQRKLGVATMILSLAWALIAVLGIQDHFAAGNIHWGRYAYLGDSPAEIVSSLLTRPDLVFAQLRAANVGRYFFLLLFPVAFTPLLGLDVLLISLPSLAINLLADFPPMHQVNELIYSAPITPFVILSSVIGVSRMQGWVAGRWREYPSSIDQSARQTVGIGLAGIVLIFTLFSQALYGYLPGSGNYMALTVTDHHRRAAAIIDQIPSDAIVSAQDRLNPHVSGRETVYIFPSINDADTVFLDTTGPAWPQHPSDVRAAVDDLLASGFGIAAADDGYLLLRKDATAIMPPPNFYSAWQAPSPSPAANAIADFGDELRLLDYRVTTDRYGELVTRLTWQALQPIADDLRFYIAYTDPDWALLHDSEFYPPPASLWYPTSSWTSETPVLVQTLPWTLDSDHFTLSVGVYRGENWQEGERLPVNSPEWTRPVFEGGTLLRLAGGERNETGEWHTIGISRDRPARALNARLDGVAQLEGVTAPVTTLMPGDALPFTIYWRARGPAPLDYSAFAHLLDANGETVAQLDWQPHDDISLLPMTIWRAGQLVADSQTLAIPEALPPGNYRLIAGLYDWQTDQRAPLTGADVLDGDVVLVGEVEVVE